jgi:hypothetical protein
MKRVYVWPSAILGIALLSACDGGGGGDAGSSNFACTAIEGAYSSVCTSCSTVQNSAALGDGDINSAATFRTYNSGSVPNSGQITMRIDRAAEGAFAAGATPGFAIQLPVATGVSYTLTPSTRLNGAVVQTGDPVTITGNTDGEFRYIGIDALSDFDGIQVVLQYSEPVGATEDIHQFMLFEACADGELRS